MSKYSCFKDKFEEMYSLYNRREYVNPDPLIFLYDYSELKDREIAGIIASGLAYGNVKQILKSVSKVLVVMKKSPYDYITSNTETDFENDFKGFKHRFTTDRELVLFLKGIKHVLNDYNSLYECFSNGYKESHDTIYPALIHFVSELKMHKQNKNSLLPDPLKRSALKRLFLYLRWMIRKDEVDPGGWDNIPCSKLIIPLDTHMFNISRSINITHRKSADLTTAMEITNAFKLINDNDPVKYDFSLTRMGIHQDFNINSFLMECKMINPG